MLVASVAAGPVFADDTAPANEAAAIQDEQSTGTGQEIIDSTATPVEEPNVDQQAEERPASKTHDEPAAKEASTSATNS
ncbi:MAG: hypothetical protein JTJ11_03595 [Collinsella sp.]|nr:hypothetical protein [Collinsella sp.]